MAKNTRNISDRDLARILEYWHIDANAGVVRWKKKPSQSVKVGSVVGSVTTKGYMRGALANRRYYIHRVIFLFSTGEQPDEIDHIDGDRLNNRISNLRYADHDINLKNKRNYKNNKSGVTGVNWYESRRKWRATITANGRTIHLGYFEKFEDAVAARRAAEKKYGFSPTHGRSSEYRRKNSHLVEARP